MIPSDKYLAQKLERTEASANADFVETRARLEPEVGAAWIEVGGAYAMFDGVESPLTQTFGLGVFEDTTAEQLEKLETFFRDRGALVFHEISPMADLSLLTLLNQRGYKPIELSSVMCRELGDDDAPVSNPNIVTRTVGEAEADLWTETAAAGWASEGKELAEFIHGLGMIASRTSGGVPFIAELDGRPIAAGSLGIYGEVCILGGASTIPEARRQGAQNALLNARLSYAREHGCTLAMICALPGSQSQKNAQKNGFNIAYTRIKWQLIE